MATITTYICDHCSNETSRLFNCQVGRRQGYGNVRERSPWTVDLCDECSNTVLECLDSFFKEGTPQGYV